MRIPALSRRFIPAAVLSIVAFALLGGACTIVPGLNEIQKEFRDCRVAAGSDRAARQECTDNNNEARAQNAEARAFFKWFETYLRDFINDEAQACRDQGNSEGLALVGQFRNEFTSQFTGIYQALATDGLDIVDLYYLLWLLESADPPCSENEPLVPTSFAIPQ